ncbi:MAG TPA: ZIP family zinc transporter [Nocardioidaceae bacterium]|nr:ZIP family zinc transporter [Nocardioidaceae bacterium]
MFEAAFWGAVGASSLLIGALIGLLVRLPRVIIGLVLGFGAGTLISAVSFELTEEAYAQGGADAVVIGLALGALAYYLGDHVVESHGAEQRMSSVDSKGVSSSASMALLLGAVLDGIPESAVIGLTLLEGGSVGVAVLAAVFISNLPESMSSSSGMRASGASTWHVMGTWCWVVLASAIAAGAGYGLLQNASGNTIALIQAFAGGAVITMLADTMMPEAFKNGGRAVGLLTVLGFALAYLLTLAE